MFHLESFLFIQTALQYCKMINEFKLELTAFWT